MEINERGTYNNPASYKTDVPAEKAKLLAQEEELFQIARLINCGWFASGQLARLLKNTHANILTLVVFSDYFSSILGLVRDGSSWSLDPFSVMQPSSCK